MRTPVGPEGNYQRARPIVCELDPDDLRSVIRDVHLRLDDAGRIGALKELGLVPQGDRQVPASLTGFLDEDHPKRFANKLAHLRERGLAHGYRNRLLWTKADGAAAYELLVRLVDALGKPPPLPAIPDEQDEDRARGVHHRVVAAACRRFCRLIKPSCETAFFWNRATDRTDFLYARGLRFPEAVTGIVWGDAVPRRALFAEDDEELEAAQVWSGIDQWPQTSGSFRTREEIKTAWVFRLRWEGSRLALFVNWRSDRLPAFEPRDLRPALRYLAGWLASSGAVLLGSTPRVGQTPMSLIAAVGRVLADGPDRAKMGRALAGVVHDALRLEAASHYAVHWVEEEGGVGSRRRWLRLAHDQYTGVSDVQSPRFSLDVPADTPVERSTAVQCAVWGASLRIPNMDAPLGRGRARDGGAAPRTWRSIDIARDVKRARGLRAKWRSRSQLLVPIKESGEVTGVINVEHPEPSGLTVAHEGCVELLAHLFARLAEAKQATKEGPGWAFLTEQFTSGTLPASGADLLTNFCDWASEATGANVVVAHGSDPASSAFRALAISFDVQFREAEIERYRQRLKRTHGELTAARVRGLASDDVLAPVIDEVLRDAMVGQSLPRRRGRTYRVLLHRRPDPIWDINCPREGPKPPAWTRARFESSVGLPLAGDVTVQPEAAIWLHWIRQPDEFVRTSHERRRTKDRRGRRADDRLLSAVQSTIGPVLGAVAAMYAVFKFLNRGDEER